MYKRVNYKQILKAFEERKAKQTQKIHTTVTVNCRNCNKEMILPIYQCYRKYCDKYCMEEYKSRC